MAKVGRVVLHMGLAAAFTGILYAGYILYAVSERIGQIADLISAMNYKP